MTTESTLYTLDEALFHQVQRGLPLVIVLTGFADAGGAVSQLEDYMWDEASPREFVTFDSDMLHDYRARRPTIVFEEDHLTEYDPPSISLSIATDDVGEAVPAADGPRTRFSVESVCQQRYVPCDRLSSWPNHVGAQHPNADPALPTSWRHRQWISSRHH